MEKRIIGKLVILSLTILLLAVLATIAAGGQTFGDFQYTTTNGEVTITKYNGDSTSVVVPSTIDGLPVTCIGKQAFQNKKTITNVTLPNGLTHIGEYAFYYCDSMVSINIPEGVVSIGQRAFGNCKSLKSIYLPESALDLGDSAFSFCQSLTSINLPKNITSLSDNLFKACSVIEGITIPEGVTSIGAGCFTSCLSIKNFDIPSGVTSIGGGAFSGCQSLTSICIPCGVASLEDDMFSYCKKLTSVELPDGIPSIGNYTFRCCESLVTMDNLPSSVASIGIEAFWGCTALTSVTIPENVTSIGRMAFSDCKSLTKITNKSDLSFSFNSEDYFGYESNVKIIVDKNGNKSYYENKNFVETNDGFIFENTGNYTLIAYVGGKDAITLPNKVNGNNYDIYQMKGARNIVIPEGVTSIGDDAFNGSVMLSSIVLPNSVKSIGDNAFYNCRSLTSINIPEGVNSIGDSAFFGCSSLTNIVLPNSLTSIGEDAFRLCSALTTMNIPEKLSIIPESFLSNCSSLTSVSIHNGVTAIGKTAFSNCSSLENITIPENVISIGELAFQGCGSLKDIVLPVGVTKIEIGTFMNCASLTNITMSGEVESIGMYAFNNCASLSGITIPNGVTSIESYAFSGCSSLKSIHIPDGVTTIGSSTFEGCIRLLSIKIPNSVTEIGDNSINKNTTIYGRANGCADLYARKYGNVFIAVESFENEENGVSVLSYNDSVTPNADFICSKVDNTETANIVIKTESEKAQAFDIHFENNGEEIQPSAAVTVKIPIPNDYDPDKCKIFHIGDDGVQHELGFVIENGYFVFSTDHFSVYAIVQYSHVVVVEDKKFTVTWKNHDGTVLETDLNVEKGTIPVYDGATPTKPGTNGETFVFKGWSPIISPVTYDVTYTALFSSVKVKYTVTWKNDDGTVLKTDSVDFDSMPLFGTQNPTKQSTAQYTYTFAGWSPEVVKVTENVTYTATYTSTVNKYKVTWMDDEGNALRIDTIDYGTTPSYGDTNPTKEKNAQYTYIFKGWDKQIKTVTEDVTYIALFNSSINRYNVTWKNYDGTVLETDEEVDFGTTPTFDGDTPTRPKDGDEIYKFVGWSPSVETVTGDVIYTAVFQKPDATITVTWKNYDGTVLQVVEDLELGTIPNYTGTTPKRSDDSRYTYTFSGWTPSVSAAIVDVTYTATFTAKEKTFTVYWVNYNGEVLEADENVKYGSIPEYNGNDPTRLGDGDYEYTFAGWSPNVSSVTKNITYTAQFSVNGQTIETTEETTAETTTETTEDTETTVEITEEVTTETTEVTVTTIETTEEITAETTEVTETTETTTETTEEVTTETTEIVETTESTQTITGVPEIVEAETKWDAKSSDSSDGLTIKSRADISSFVEVRINGKVLDRKYYDVFEGSTIIVIKKSYLETLPNGNYNIEIVSTDGVANTKFEVVNSNVPADNANNSSTLIIIIAVVTAVVIIAVVVVIVVVNKKKKEED